MKNGPGRNCDFLLLHFAFFILHCLLLTAGLPASAQDAPRLQRVLLLAQSPDGHPPAAHEYIASLRIMDLMLRQQPRIETRMVIADSPWADGPALLDQADAAVLFLAEGAKWVS